MTGRRPPEPKDDLGERLSRFRNEREVATGRARKPRSNENGLGLAMRVGVELVAALIVGVGLGVLLDEWLGTMPLMSLLGFVFGAAAGFLNVYRASTGQGGTVGYRKRPDGDEGPDDQA